MYGYDQEVGSRELEGEVGRAEVHQSQGSEQPEHGSQAREQRTLGIQERGVAEEALREHEKAEHSGEEERERAGTRQLAQAEHGDGPEEGRGQEEHR